MNTPEATRGPLPGFARVKSEFVIAQQPREQNDCSGDSPLGAVASASIGADRPGRVHGMDRQREQKMAKARAECHQRVLRICPSALFPDEKRQCKYGASCTAEHSRQEYWAQKPADIGPNCVLFDQMGKCPFSLACSFARAHTNSGDLTQSSQEPDPNWSAPINSQTLDLQQKLRKKHYNFDRAETALKDKVGSMGQEAPKIDMCALRGKRYLAPLTTVGNLPFRRLCVELGAEVTCGEMAMATNLLKGLPSELSLMKRHSSEKIFGVQLAGGYPDTLSKAVQLVTENFSVDFIDLNLGCPLDAVNERGGGCSLANKSNRLLEVLRCMQSTAGGTPITVKMRYGMREGQRTAHHTLRTIAARQSAPRLLTLHPRSREQRYTKAAEWDYVGECARQIDGRFPFFVCGDILSFEDYYQRLESHPIDGIMIGRGALIKPWIFTEIEERRHWDITSSERFELIKRFANYGLENWGSDHIGVENTRRFLLEWLSFQHRYIPVGLLEELPQRINQRPPPYRGRDDLETLLSSPASSDWVKITELVLGKTPEGFLFVPKHRASAF